MCYIGGMNATINTPEQKVEAMKQMLRVVVNDHPLPLFHAMTIHVALQELGARMSKRGALGKDGEDMRKKYLTAIEQINSLYIQ